MTSFRAAISGLPEQLVETALRDDGLRDAAAAIEDVDGIVFAGMGGSGIAAEIACTCAAPEAQVPLMVLRDYELPHWVSRHSLVVAVSHSGNTEETVTAFAAAQARGARLAVVASGGVLAAIADADASIVHARVPGGMMPRAALGALVAACVVILEGAGVYPSGIEDLLNAAQQLAWRRDELANARSSAQVAADLAAFAVPITYGGGPAGRVAATRWKADLNENAKIQAFASTLPEANHNDVCGWQAGSRRFCAVLLRHAYEHPRVGRRFGVMRPILEESAFGVVDIVANGAGPLAQLLDLAYQGTWASLFLADARGIDPESIPTIDRIKRELAPSEPKLVAGREGTHELAST